MEDDQRVVLDAVESVLMLAIHTFLVGNMLAGKRGDDSNINMENYLDAAAEWTHAIYERSNVREKLTTLFEAANQE